MKQGAQRQVFDGRGRAAIGAGGPSNAAGPTSRDFRLLGTVGIASLPLFPGTVGTGSCGHDPVLPYPLRKLFRFTSSSMVFARFPARLAQAPLTTRDCRTTHCGEVAADSYLFHDFFFVVPAWEAIKGLCGARHSCMRAGGVRGRRPRSQTWMDR